MQFAWKKKIRYNSKFFVFFFAFNFTLKPYNFYKLWELIWQGLYEKFYIFYCSTKERVKRRFKPDRHWPIYVYREGVLWQYASSARTILMSKIHYIQKSSLKLIKDTTKALRNWEQVQNNNKNRDRIEVKFNKYSTVYNHLFIEHTVLLNAHAKN